MRKGSPVFESRLHFLRTGILFASLLAPVLALFGIIIQGIVNIPYIDDYPNFLGFSLNYEGSHSLGPRLAGLITAQHGEYRFILMHLIVIGELTFTHHVNMIVLSLVGDLFMVGIGAILWNVYFNEEPSLRRRLLLFLPAAYLIFQANYAEGLGWASAALDYFPVLFFSLLSLLLLTRSSIGGSSKFENSTFLWACLAACLGCWSAPNAVLLLPLGLIVLLPRKAYLRAFLWSISFLLWLAPYFYHYVAPPPNQKTTLRLLTLYFLTFVGASSPTIKVAVPFGLCMLCLFGYALRSGFYRTHPAAVLGVAWIFGSAALASFGRSFAGVALATQARYKIFSDVVLIFCYFFVATRIAASPMPEIRKIRLYRTALALAIPICLYADFKGRIVLAQQRSALFTGLARYNTDPSHNSPMYFANPADTILFSKQEVEARILLQQATQQNLYFLPR